ncbi:MAG: hypothetical protein IT303_06805 [Dehalococcoidia bacterium]|nr:hypothetical protein [Dehalococcoidia bacterium]
MDDQLRDRGKSLEEEFFQRQNAELVAKLRATQARDEARSHMAAATGITHAEALDRLLDHGLSPASVAALALAPLVAVAWADRKLEDKERAEVLKEAADSGVTQGSAEYELLESWLQQAPPATLMEAWGGYARAVSADLDEAERTEFREAIVARAKAIAKAAGGFAGMGKTSPEEERTLAEISAALSG